MQVISDLQLHSKYARAVSREMVIPKIWEWAKIKGIGIVATGDWTHPLWMREIKANLEEMGGGLLKLKDQSLQLHNDSEEGPLFLLEAEVSCIYSQGGRVRRIHILIFSPSIESAEKINKELIKRGANLLSDGRPILGMTSQQICEVVLSIDSKCLIIPAHIWTPYFSLFGSESGFDSIDECFGQYSKSIYAVETGLSSSPSMNWRIKELDSRSILSFSDAHSGPKLGREATVFELSELSFDAIREAIVQKTDNSQQSTLRLGSGQADNRIAYTVEFYPEEGKYHYTGHRNCGVKQAPFETRQKGTLCHVCGRRLTVGVMHRVDQLAGRSEEDLKIYKKNIDGTAVRGIFSETLPNRPPYIMLVPLQEILAEVFGGLPTSQRIQNEYRKLTDALGGEFNVLLNTPVEKIEANSSEKLGDAIHRVRNGDIVVDPGYDGVFGVVKIWGNEKKRDENKEKEQMSLF